MANFSSLLPTAAWEEVGGALADGQPLLPHIECLLGDEVFVSSGQLPWQMFREYLTELVRQTELH